MHNDKEFRGSSYDTSSGYADGVELRRILFEVDQRRFPQILSDWVRDEGKGDHSVFLQKTGLSPLLSPEQLRAMELGESVPGKRLASIMAMHQPGQFFREGEESATHHQLYKFQRRAEYFRNQKRNSPSVIELSDGEFQNYSVSALGKIARDANVQRQPVTASQPDPEMNANVLGYLQTLRGDRRQAPPPREELMATLLKQYKKAPAETVAGLQHLLSASPHDYSSQEIEGWFAAAAPAKEVSAAAKSLRFLRESHGATQEEIEAKIKSNGILTHYEKGYVNISARNAVTLASALVLGDDEAVSFFAAVNPSVRKEWLQRQVQAKNLEIIASPALDPAMLAEQPPEKRVGALLQAYLDRASISIRGITEKLHVDEQNISEWKMRGVPVNRLEALSQALGLSEQEQTYFSHINTESRRARRTEFNKVNIKALDAAWLSQQPEQEQAGLLLTAFSTRNALTMGEIGEAISVSHNKVFSWHHGTVPDEHMDALANVLTLRPEEKTLFERINAQSRRAIEVSHINAKAAGTFGLMPSGKASAPDEPAFVLDHALIEKQPEEKQAGIMLKAFSKRAGIKHYALAGAIGVTSPTLRLWESGELPVPSHKAGTFAKVLKLSGDEAEYFIGKISPDAKAPTDWLKNKIKLQQWDHIDSPAFDEKWISAQLEEKRAGLTLKAGRLRRDLSQEQLGDLIGTARNAIIKWEHGAPIAANKLGELVEHLKLSEEEAARFIAQVPGGAALIQHQISTADSLALSFPAFNDEWLQAQPQAKRAGLLLRAHREHNGISQKDFARTLQVNNSTVSDWEVGDMSITPSKIGSILGALQLDVEQAKKLAVLAHPELAEHTNGAWLTGKIAQKQWQHIDLPAIDPQWLSAQPERQQAGLLLRAYRERLHMNQGTFAKTVSRDRGTISDTELSFRDMREKELPSFAAALQLSDDEKDRLADVVSLSRAARGIEKAQTSLGATVTGQQAKELSGVETHTRRR